MRNRLKRRPFHVMFALAAIAAAALAVSGQTYFNRVFPQDKGPATLDVSGYPPAIQRDYKIFARDCSRCHTLARPLNTTMNDSFWARYLGGMMQNPTYQISLKDAKAIYAFLSYDQAHRKDKNPGKFHPALTLNEIALLPRLKTN